MIIPSNVGGPRGVSYLTYIATDGGTNQGYYHAATKKLFVTTYNSVKVIDTTTDTISKTITYSNGYHWGIDYSPLHDRIYVAAANLNYLWSIDPNAEADTGFRLNYHCWDVAASKKMSGWSPVIFSEDAARNPGQLGAFWRYYYNIYETNSSYSTNAYKGGPVGLTADGGKLYMNDLGYTTIKVFTVTQTNPAPYESGSIDQIKSISSSEGRSFYATTGKMFARTANSVDVYETTNDTKTKTITLPDVSYNNWCGMTVNDGKLYTTYNNGLATIDLASETLVATISLSSIPNLNYGAGDLIYGNGKLYGLNVGNGIAVFTVG